MPTRVIPDVVLVGGVPTNGLAVSAYKASRLTGVPALNTALPVGVADAGPVTTGTAFGGTGQFQITCPTSEDYYLTCLQPGGDRAWALYPTSGPGGPLSLPGPAPTGAATVLSLTEARDLIGTALDDAALNRVIAAEESWLERRIGKLSGPRTQATFVSPYDVMNTLLLIRPTAEDGSGITAVTDGTNTVSLSDVRVVKRGTGIERIAGWWVATTDLQFGPVKVTYIPNDLAEVKSALIDLVRLRLPDPGLQSESVEGYSYTRAPASRATRDRIARDLLPNRRSGLQTVSLRGSLASHRVSNRTWSAWWPLA